ncbi:MAG: DUF1559 domain-containing protein [Gemmataceae bacterium]|nr:DUF1559 domain-containing protein [Gemmataceae bacterium]
MTADRRPRPAVSLIEVLVVIGITGVLVGLLMNAVQSARAAAARVSCANRMRQIGLAATMHHDAQGALPQPSAFVWRYPPSRRRAYVPWTNVLLPYIEQDALWRTIQPAYATSSGYENPPHVGLTTVVPVYTCPADGRLTAPITDDLGYTAAYGSYQGVIAPRDNPAAMDYLRKVRMTDVTDGTSQTLLIGERPPPGRALAGNWYSLYLPDSTLPYSTGYMYASALAVQGEATGSGRCRGRYYFGPGRIENPCDSYHFWSFHPGGGNFLFVDGSVRFLPYSANGVLPALATRAGGETADIP